MPHCDCGFDFVQARLKGRRLQAYALIPQKGYQAAIRREHAIIVEKHAGKKLRRIANASSHVGSLTQCPRCGAWLMEEPTPPGRTGLVRLRKPKPAARKAAPATATAPRN